VAALQGSSPVAFDSETACHACHSMALVFCVAAGEEQHELLLLSARGSAT
jgi:hypothetical protein